MKPLFKLVFIFSILSLSIQKTTAQTASSQNILFIFDASGSMWGKIDKSTKIQVAKETMDKLSQTISDKANVGLIVYGHRSASDCNDIETMLPIAMMDKAKFASKIKALNPKGKTPIDRSINQSLALIRGINDPVTIILVSDGLETCDGNACETVKKARAAGVKITVHVVGFGISEKDLSPLECIAQAGGGQYFGANNAEELAAALEQTVKETPAGDAVVSVKTLLEGKLVDATVRVVKKGDPKDIAGGRTYESAETNPRLLPIPSGTYDIIVEGITIRNRPTQTFENVEIKSGDTLYKEVSFDQGIVEVKVTRNGTLSDATINFYKAGTRENITGARSYNSASSNPVKFKVPPGEYDIEIKAIEISSAPVHLLEKVQVKGSSTANFDHNFLSGELSIGAKNAQGYVDATVNIYDEKTGKNVGAGRTYQSASSNPKKFTLEPGKYRVDLNGVKPPGSGKKSVTVEVTANGSVEKIVEW